MSRRLAILGHSAAHRAGIASMAAVILAEAAEAQRRSDATSPAPVRFVVVDDETVTCTAPPEPSEPPPPVESRQVRRAREREAIKNSGRRR